MASIEENKRIVRQWFEHISASRPADAFGLFSSEATYSQFCRSELAFTVPAKQMPELVQAFLGRLKNGMKMWITGITAENERVACEAESQLEFRNGPVYSNLYHFLFVVRDGKIVEAREYADTLYASQSGIGAKR